MKVLIITPACNEENHLPQLIQSVINQSVVPITWIIVDDGSIDNTSNVIQNAAVKHSWIQYLRKEKKDKRSPGKSVMETFYYGLNNSQVLDYDIIMKLDADLVLPKNYLLTVIDQFQQDSKIGMCGGVCVIDSGSDHVIEKETNLDHIRGAIKAYRKECFQDINGLLKSMGWDTVDEHYSRFKGWKVVVLKDLHVLHQRSTHKEYGFIKASFRNGIMLYTIRMDLLLLCGNCIKKVFRYPYVILAIAMFWGYMVAFFSREKRIVTKELGCFIRKYRYNQIFERLK